MDMRLMFNQDPESYDKFRPTYVQALFEEVVRFSSLDAHKKALEIGIGTGQATEPFLRTGAQVTAVEIGDQLAEFSRKKFAAYDNFQVINQDFESVPLESGAFDLVYSASAFHWVPPEMGLPKVRNVLKQGGVFAWFANQPTPSEADMQIHEAFQEVYDRHDRFFGKAEPLARHEEWLKKAEEKKRHRADMLRQYGFAEVMDKTYHSTRTLNAQEYVTLLSTYSDHKAMPEAIRTPFFKEIEQIINRYGGKFTLSDIITLCMGKNP